MEELRQAKRVPFEGPIEQLVTHCSDYPRLDTDDEFIHAKAINISSGGIACESSRKVDPLCQVYFIFSLPAPGGKRSIRCEGYVTHSSYDGQRCVFGVRFEDLSPEDRAAVDAYIAARA